MTENTELDRLQQELKELETEYRNITPDVPDYTAKLHKIYEQKRAMKTRIARLKE